MFLNYEKHVQIFIVYNVYCLHSLSFNCVKQIVVKSSTDIHNFTYSIFIYKYLSTPKCMKTSRNSIFGIDLNITNRRLGRC